MKDLHWSWQRPSKVLEHGRIRTKFEFSSQNKNLSLRLERVKLHKCEHHFFVVRIKAFIFQASECFCISYIPNKKKSHKDLFHKQFFVCFRATRYGNESCKLRKEYEIATRNTWANERRRMKEQNSKLKKKKKKKKKKKNERGHGWSKRAFVNSTKQYMRAFSS